MGCMNNFILGYFRLFNIKHLKKCTQSSGSFHKCSNDLRPTVVSSDILSQNVYSCNKYHMIRYLDQQCMYISKNTYKAYFIVDKPMCELVLEYYIGSIGPTKINTIFNTF